MNSKSLLTPLKRIVQNWVVLVALLLLLLMMTHGAPLWAATIREINQTVPIPTATKLPTAVPPATATPKPPPTSSSGGNSGSGQQSQSTSTPTEKSATTQKLTATVKSKTLNVRSGPGTGYLVIGVLKEGDKLEIVGRNAKGDWWRVCCLAGTDVHGWVSSNFLTPDFDATQAQKLIPIASDIPAASTPTSTPVPAAEPTKTAEQNNTKTAIEVSFTEYPSFPLQGSIVTMQITVTNPTTTNALDVELRDELPKGMSIVSVEAMENAIVQQDVTENLREVYSVLWPTLAVGEVVTATAKLLIDPALPNGAVVDNLLYAGGANVPGSTVGISIGMPPASLPEFQ